METPRSFARFTRLDNGINESLLAYLMSFEQLDVHARLLRGDWASNTDEAVIGAELAADLSLDVGSVVAFSPERQFTISGVIEPAAANPERVLAFHYTDVWFDLQFNLTPGGAEEPYFGLFASPAALERFGAPVTHRMRTELDTEALNSDQVDAAIEAIDAWQQQLSRLEGGSAGTLLLGALQAFARQAQFSAGQSLLAGLQIAAVAMFGVALVGRVLAQRTRVDRERLAARGAKPWQQAGAQAMLGGLAAVPAVRARRAAGRVRAQSCRTPRCGRPRLGRRAVRHTFDLGILGAGRRRRVDRLARLRRPRLVRRPPARQSARRRRTPAAPVADPARLARCGAARARRRALPPVRDRSLRRRAGRIRIRRDQPRPDAQSRSTAARRGAHDHASRASRLGLGGGRLVARADSRPGSTSACSTSPATRPGQCCSPRWSPSSPPSG